ncbi:translation initiation factor IF-2 [Lacticaseibacillus thailandensis]|uniref:Translation initiation factor IF-2 n=1 Tax=Lacticaseibacillus thailandensis DSM 22698 = JCM 13996 TaxID=1423810 RepID=A0A0R2C9E3_9LACO|nr:translation initiation factor IF-2 [Lacticaseibacillus thailandensis]KRM88199.1 translation initiation factor IF-2 [Lacticaseibacillus thailandensis DSM 22698 = JCM 13996]
MGKKRIYEFAKENNVTSKEVIAAAKKAGLTGIKSSMNSIDDNDASKVSAVLKDASTSSAAPKAAAKPVASAVPAKSAAAPASAAAKPSAEAKKPGTSHAQHKTADGKTLISRSAIRRPGTQNNHNATRNNHQGNRNQGGNNRGQGNNGNRGQNDNRNRNNGGNRNNNGGRNDNRRGGNNRNDNRRNDNRRGNNRQPEAPMPRVSRAAAAAARLRQHQQTEFRTSSAPIGRFEEPKPQRSAAASSAATKPAAAASQSRQALSAAKPAAKSAAPARSAANQQRTTSSSSRPKPQRQRNYGTGRETPYKGRRKNKKRRQQRNNEPRKPVPQRKERPLPETLVYTEGMNAQELGKILHREPAEIIKKLFMLGIMVNQNQSLDKDTIELIAEDYGIKSQEKVEEDITDLDKVFEAETTSTENLQPRPPVITIMGHVDHGKTTLLDKLRHTHVTEGEAGGITQHIGAYQVKLNDRLITFLDTPGHAAFTNMRARGADITDIVVLVVAANDGVMPQTVEAINHAKAAGAPIIVAINKIDKPGANPNRVIEELAEYELIPESWGGDTIFVNISAKYGKNIDELLEMILLEADVLELKANPDQKAVGTVIEARLDKGKGPMATVLVQQGTLHVGDPVVVGNTYGRVRVMTNDRGRRVKDATPSMPVEITGLNDVPQSADKLVVFDDEKTARAAGEERASRALDKERRAGSHVTLDNLFETMKEGQMKEVDVIIKADVQGSVEAIDGSLKKINVEGVRVNIIHESVGAINESDVTLASASNAIIIGFNVRPTAQARAQAEQEDVDIRLHSVIYKAIDEIEAAMKGQLDPVYEEKVIGSLTVRETIKVSKVGTVAGCLVDSGRITRDSGVRLVRDGIVIYEGKLGSLRRFKDDVKEVKSGFECGLTIENYNDIKVDDQIEAYTMEQVPVK